MQSRLDSLVEALIGVLIGFQISFVANAVILPAMGFPISLSQNLLIGFFMTIISVARTYVIRRWAQVHLTALRQRIVAAIVKRVPRLR